MDVERLQSCPICNSSDLSPFCKARDTIHFLEGEFEVAECMQCKTYSLVTRPTPESIAYYYPKTYYTHKSDEETGESLKDVLRDKAYSYYYGHDKNVINAILYNILKKHINMFPPLNKPSPTMLDFGCGNRNLIKIFSKYGFIVDGFDIDPRSAKYAEKYARRVYVGDINTLNMDAEYDIILVNHVLEHLHNPQELLKKLRTMLSSDGVVIISVPNSDMADFHLLRDVWVAFDTPRYLVHFNERALKDLLRMCGLEAYRTEYSSVLKSVSKGVMRRHIKLMWNRKDVQGLVLYILSSLMIFVPVVNRLKADRITLYARKTVEGVMPMRVS